MTRYGHCNPQRDPLWEALAAGNLKDLSRLIEAAESNRLRLAHALETVQYDVESAHDGRRELRVEWPVVHGYSWRLIREDGMGTYASIASPSPDLEADDVDVVIEEHERDTPEREMWDRSPDDEAVYTAYMDLIRSAGEEDDDA